MDVDNVGIFHSAAMQASIALKNIVPNAAREYQEKQRQMMLDATGSGLAAELARLHINEAHRLDATTSSLAAALARAHIPDLAAELAGGVALAKLYETTRVWSLGGIYIPDCSPAIRSTPKTEHQERKAEYFKSRDNAEDAVILTEDKADYQAIVFALGLKAGIAPPQSKEDEALFVERLHQRFEEQKPREATIKYSSGRTCQLHDFIWRVYCVIKKPTVRAVEKEIRVNYENHDNEGIVIRISDSGIEWRSKYNNDGCLKWSCLNATISKCKAKYQKQAASI